MMSKLPCVLLVDDDPTTNFLNHKLLLRLGITDHVRVALNGQEALAALRACQNEPAGCPALIFLDVNMPVMGGLDFLEAYQQLPADQRPATVVALLTTSVNPRDQQRADQLPIAAYLTKPLTQQQVEQVVAQHFA
jgi:CheY-like chemotaxis protein